jgi:hypothetical protein
MNKNHLAVWAGALACGLPLAAAAQARATDPTRSAQQTPALRYDSAFKDYKPWQDTKPADWRGVNDALKDALKDGSHAGHGAAAPAGAGSAPAAGRPAGARSAAPAPTSPAASHGGHGGARK